MYSPTLIVARRLGKGPHNKAAEAFIGFLATKEAQTSARGHSVWKAMQSLVLLADPVGRDCIILSLKVAALACRCWHRAAFIGLSYTVGHSEGPWIASVDFLITLPLVSPAPVTGFLLSPLFSCLYPGGLANT